MDIGVYFSCSALIILSIFALRFYLKPRIKNDETDIYSILLILTILGLLLEILTCIWFKMGVDVNDFIYKFFSKLTVSYYFIWSALFYKYLLIICKSTKKTQKIFNVLIILIFMVLMFLPMNFYQIEGIITPKGIMVNVVYVLCFIFTLLDIYMCIKHHKHLTNSKFTPLYALLVLGSLDFVLGVVSPQLFLIGYIFSLIIIIMFFTIENPDVKMIEQLNIARDQAEKANNAKTEFLSNMSHEIRTPLNAIDGFSQLILEENNIDTIKDEARDIMAPSQNLLEIVNGILDISKIEANKLEIVNVEYEPHKVFDELVKLTKARIGDKPLEFKVNIAKDLPEYLNGDYIRLKQIAVNLLTNAVKYTKNGSITLNVDVVKKDNVCRLIISVKDTGIGIKKENLDKIFTKFERLDLEKNITIEGTGLGLAITKKLVELMHGKIVVNSTYGKGSTFTVAIDQKIVKKVKTIKVVEEEKTTKQVNLKGKKVLIVDDNLINLKVAARLLLSYKIETEEVSSGFDCIKKIEEGNKYDLILMDDMMPKMSGVETFKKLQEIDGFDIPVVALTANAIAGMKENYLKQGFNDYISKPIDKKELERVLKTYLKAK